MTNYDVKIKIPIKLFTDIKINPNSFVLYSYLKLKESLNLDEKVIIYGNELKEVCKLNKNELLKKHLIELRSLKLISFENENFNNSSKFEIEVKELNCGYTLISTSIFKYLDKIKPIGFKLLSYYKFKEFKNKYAYPSFLNIENDLELSPTSITKYNKLLVDNKLLKIKKSKFEKDEYSDYNSKNNNCYYILL